MKLKAKIEIQLRNAVKKHRVNVKQLPDKINDKKEPGVGMGTLTAMDRDTWFS